jgi:pilus assembly protein CpaF
MNHSWESLKADAYERIAQAVDLRRVGFFSDEQTRRALHAKVDDTCRTQLPAMAPRDLGRLVEELMSDLVGLGPLDPLIADPKVTDILVNGPDHVYVERGGKLEQTNIRFPSDAHVAHLAMRIGAFVGRTVNDACPVLDARLPDGSRVNAILPPLAIDGTTMSIRRFGKKIALEELLASKMLTPEMALVLECAVKARLNIAVSGGTGSGKTTCLNVLSSFIPDNQRVVTIEDAAELRLQQAHVVRLETRPPGPDGQGAFTARDLLRNALRMRPDRIIVGECRGAEALDTLQAMNTGHEGSLTTLHANTPRDALGRLETMVLMGGFELPVRAIRQQIASAIDVVVQVARLPGGRRRITHISEILGLEQDMITMQDLFTFRRTGVDAADAARGQFECLGVRPKFMAKLEASGARLPANLFQQRVLLRD